MTATIYAVSSGRPPAAIAVLRVSGPAARAAGEALAGALPPPRRAALRTLRDSNGAVLDRALCLWFPGPATATGEDLVEFHAHGGRAVVAAIEAALAALPGLRVAEPGEFTRRALIAGRIDLAQAQGLADLLAAETEQQRRVAIASSEGRVSKAVGDWLARLSAIGATIEAALDFDDEDDVAPLDPAAIGEAVAAFSDDLGSALARPAVERLTEGSRIVLSGPPNVGKSSLFNALTDRDGAIVSPIAGTTRDCVEARVTRQGRIYTLIDTAGLRESDDPIERIGIARARRAADTADLVLWLADTPDGSSTTMWVYPRCDLPDRRARVAGTIAVSIHDADTIDVLWESIAARTSDSMPVDSILFHRAERTAIELACSELDAVRHSGDLLLLAEAVRHASRGLAAILGIDATEAMLDALFTRFCVGK